MAPSIKNVIILGAGGNIGTVVTPIILDSSLNVSVLTRPDSESKVDPRAKVIKASYEPASLRKAFEGQDAVISFIGSSSLASQKEVIDAAADAHVKLFIPSDFGSDTTNPEIVKLVPFFQGKADIAEHLRSKESTGLSWTGFITGPFLDWCLAIGFTDIDVPKREARLWSGGNTKWTTTTLPTIGKAVTRLLTTPEVLDKSKNRYVAIETATLSQRDIIEGLEKLTGDKFKVVEDVDSEKAGDAAREKLATGDFSAIKDLILSASFGPHGLGNYRTRPGLDNDLLLPGHQEPLEDVLKRVLKQLGQ